MSSTILQIWPRETHWQLCVLSRARVWEPCRELLQRQVSICARSGLCVLGRSKPSLQRGGVLGGRKTQDISELLCGRRWRRLSAGDSVDTLSSPLGRCTGGQYACYRRLLRLRLLTPKTGHCCNIKCSVQMLKASVRALGTLRSNVVQRQSKLEEEEVYCNCSPLSNSSSSISTISM